MTAEVAIVNASAVALAVALAADSAVTIGGQKIYNSALKLFSLSKIAPVGTMIYGNATLMDVPWEVLIKTYRKELGHKTYETLEEYASEFINFLNGNKKFFTPEQQEEIMLSRVSGYYELIRDEVFSEIHPILEAKGEVTEDEVANALSMAINRHHLSLRDLDFAEGMDEKFAKIIREKYLNTFKNARKDVFENLRINRSNITKLYNIAKHITTKKIFPDDVTGLVVAGYGESDIYPTIKTFVIEGVVEQRLKYDINENKVIFS